MQKWDLLNHSLHEGDMVEVQYVVIYTGLVVDVCLKGRLKLARGLK